MISIAIRVYKIPGEPLARTLPSNYHHYGYLRCKSLYRYIQGNQTHLIFQKWFILSALFWNYHSNIQDQQVWMCQFSNLSGYGTHRNKTTNLCIFHHLSSSVSAGYPSFLTFYIFIPLSLFNHITYTAIKFLLLVVLVVYLFLRDFDLLWVSKCKYINTSDLVTVSGWSLLKLPHSKWKTLVPGDTVHLSHICYWLNFILF